MNLKDIENYWLEASADSFDTAKALLDNCKYVHSMFFLHLSIEKILKGLFVNRNQSEPPYIHNLQMIASNVKNVTFNEETLNFLTEVTTFNIAARYDDYKKNFYQLCTLEFAQEKLIKGEEIIKWIRSHFIS